MTRRGDITRAAIAILIVYLVMVCFAGGVRGHDGSLQMHEAEGLNFWGGHEPELSITGTATTADLRLDTGTSGPIVLSADSGYDPNELSFFTIDPNTNFLTIDLALKGTLTVYSDIVISCDYTIVTEEPNLLVVDVWDIDLGWSLIQTTEGIEVLSLKRIKVGRPYEITTRKPECLAIAFIEEQEKSNENK